jgi:hypothetical protein
VELTTGDFTVGQTTLKAASNKVVKHESACSNNQHAFIQFAFDTFGFLAPDAVNMLKRVQQVMHTGADARQRHKKIIILSNNTIILR